MELDAHKRGTIMGGLCIAMLIACLDSTIVSTCGPVITADIGGEDIYSWILTAYLLCETIMIPISGKLSDLYGRRPFFIIGLVLFTVGSTLAGLSTDIHMFILCRGIQGTGGGILIPVVTSAVGDLYTHTARAKMQGVIATIFGIGSGLGPLVGGYIAEYISWHWAFYINVPLALVSFLMVVRNYPNVESINVKIDSMGIVVLTAFLVDLLLFFEWAGDEFEWISTESACMVVFAIILMVAFILVERRAIEPVLNLRLIRNRTVVQTAVFLFIFGFAMMGASTYISFLGINYLGFTVLKAGEYAMAMVVGMIITSSLSGAMVDRTGYRVWLTTGPVIAAVGLILMSYVDLESTIPYILLCLFLFGLGLGCIMSIVLTAVQNSSEPSEIGMTTSAVNLFRNIGTTMGTAVFALIINSRISDGLDALVPGTIPQYVCDLLPHDTSLVVIAKMPAFADISDILLEVFRDSVALSFIFAAVLLLVLVMVGVVFKAKRPSEV